MRLFIAITFNDEVKNNLCEVIVRLKAQSFKGNFSSRSLLHATLAFIGETEETDKVIAAMDSVISAPFTIDLGGYGIFKKRTGNIHWAGIRISPELTDLHDKLITALKERGFAPDETEFNPHLTLGRDVETVASFNPAAFSRSVPKQQQFVTDITLMKSEHIGGKLTYTPVYIKKL
jgi:2'-5' RNA ligase